MWRSRSRIGDLLSRMLDTLFRPGAVFLCFDPGGDNGYNDGLKDWVGEKESGSRGCGVSLPRFKCIESEPDRKTDERVRNEWQREFLKASALSSLPVILAHSWAAINYYAL